MFFAEAFTMFVLKLITWIKSDPNNAMLLKILTCSLVYGFIIYRFTGIFLDYRKATLGAQISLEIEKERTKQLEAASKKG